MNNLNNLQEAINELNLGQYTCVITQDNKVIFTSEKRGVAPLVDFIKKADLTKEYGLADKVIGKAAALLCIKANINNVYTRTISSAAKDIFDKSLILYYFDTEVDVIKNRTNTGLCPMEQLSEGVTSPDEMYKKVILWLDSK